MANSSPPMIPFQCRLGFFLGGNKNMPRVDFGLRLLRLGRLIIGRFDRRVGGRRLRDLLEHAFHQQFLTVIGELLGKFRGLIGLFGERLLRHQFAVDQKVEKIAVAGFAFELRREARGRSSAAIFTSSSVICLPLTVASTLAAAGKGRSNRKRGHGQHARQTGGFDTRVFRQEHECGLRARISGKIAPRVFAASCSKWAFAA